MRNVDVGEYLAVRKEFMNFIAEANGLVFDAYKAYELHTAKLQSEQDRFDQRRNSKGEFETVEEHLWYASNQHMLERTLGGGSHLRFIGNYAIVTLYQLWEENIRRRLAEALSVEKNEINHPAFGDLRNFRHAIIHNVGTATEEVADNELFTWFHQGDEVYVDKIKFASITQVILGITLDHNLIPNTVTGLADYLRKEGY